MPVDTRAVAAEARRVLAANRQRGVSEWDGRRYDFVCPSRATYPFQWFWDSAFHAIALLHVDPDLAKQEVRCLMQGAQPDGFMPHMLLWEKSAHDAALREYSITLAHTYYTATIQPPVIARAVARIFEATGDVAFVREVLPPIIRFFRWLKAYRDPDDDGLVAIIQPDESGLDASPKYDRRMRIAAGAETLPQLRRSMQRLFDAYAPLRSDPAGLLALDVFVWEDVMVNVIYADGLRALGGLCRAAGASDIEAREFETRARRVVNALQEKCWDDRAGAFWDLDGWDEERARVLTFSSLFPLVLADLDPMIAKRLVEEHLLNEREFWLSYPIPTVAASEPSFDPGWTTRTTWRGPTWINVNWYLYHGLRAHGYREVASQLAERTFAMVAKSGIREFYDPRSAEGQGAVDFGWSCLVLDLIAAEGRPLE
ncbi:MAG TPA: trehalase family glycosidase [Candidatus Limnocylindria bacterium]|nr:trehalase family glycosidase [Candidatus Limnocylindria bacterium]